jgi:hypothetical protein
MPPSQRGHPMLADAATGERILKRIQRPKASLPPGCTLTQALCLEHDVGRAVTFRVLTFLSDNEKVSQWGPVRSCRAEY